MVNSIRTTSNTQTTTSAPTTPLFSVGTVVLCPSFSRIPFSLTDVERTQ